MKEKEYIVALAIDDNEGNVDYCNKEVIEANSKKSAETKYNKKNGCDYLHGVCLGRHYKNKLFQKLFGVEV